MGAAGETRANVGFSSRRRNARVKCGWSSDVCSSDLGNATGGSGLFLSSGAVVNNVAGATWDIVNGESNVGDGIIFNGGGAPAFQKAGNAPLNASHTCIIHPVFRLTNTTTATHRALSTFTT